MRKYLVLLCILAIVSFGAPNNHADAISKYDFSMNFVDTSSSELVPVYIRLETEPVVSQLTFDGKFSTSTAEINRPGNLLKTISLRGVLHEQHYAVNELKSRFASIDVISTSQLLTNRVYAYVPANQIEQIAQLDFVTEVSYNMPVEPHRDWSKKTMNCIKVYEGAEDYEGEPCVDPQGRQVNGTGILCSVTDSGLDYTHPDFGSQSKPEGKKVVIARDYAENDGDPQEADGQYHGTACAGIIAGNASETERGIAWEARLAAYKIGDSRGRLSGDIARTWEDMILDEVDVSNNSYGHPYGYSTQREAINNAVSAGVSIVASQGNSGSPGPILPIPCGSTGSPANAIAVGALDDWATKSTMTIIETPNRDFEDRVYNGVWGATNKEFTQYNQPFELVDCGWGRPQDFEGLDLAGKAALIQRGPLDPKFGAPFNHSTKILNASDAGAAVVVYYNHSPGVFTQAFYLNPDDKPRWGDFLPSYQLSESEGIELRNLLHEGHDWELGVIDKRQNMVIVKIGKPEFYGNITSFSSSGPSQYAGLKPDVCGPGENIHTTLATNQWDRQGSMYTETFNGTSAAGPFVAGVSCLVRQANPEWDAFEVKRALMNTASILHRATDNNYIPFISQGMGRVNAFEACTTDILIQPPSTLILTDSNYINSEDSPFEWKDKALKSTLPADIQRSQIAYKIFNYSEDNSHHIELSYEINSRQADDIKVKFTSDSVKVPTGSKEQPNYAWVGVTIERPGRLKGGTNDIVIWFTDKKTGQKWHTGICLYSNSPSIQGSKYHYFDYVDISPYEITPNGDGITDTMDVDFTVTCGSDFTYYQYHENFLVNPTFGIYDYNGNSWYDIKNWSYLELGEYDLFWDGKDDSGEELLPDGEWYTGLTYNTTEIDWSRRVAVSVTAPPITFFNSPFQVTNSVVPPLPLITAHPIPTQPGMGSEFEVGIYIEHAVNVKSTQFYVVIPGLDDIARYMGYRVGDFMAKDEPLLLPIVEPPDEGSSRIWIDLQRPLDGVSGEGWLVFLRFMPKTSNFMDVTFENLNISYINEETWAEEYKFAFYKSSSITIDKEYFAQTDFNKDGRTDNKDREILNNCIGSKRGDSNFNWRCDLNYDSIVDINDLMIFAKYVD